MHGPMDRDPLASVIGGDEVVTGGTPAVASDIQPADRLEAARADLAEVVNLLEQAGITRKAIAKAAYYVPAYVNQLVSSGAGATKPSARAIGRLTRAASYLYPAVSGETLEPTAAAHLGQLLTGLTEQFGNESDKKTTELSPQKHRLVYSLVTYMLEQRDLSVNHDNNAGGVVRADLAMSEKQWQVAYRYLAGLGLFTSHKKGPTYKAYTAIAFETERLLLLADHLDEVPAFIDETLLEKARRKVK